MLPVAAQALAWLEVSSWAACWANRGQSRGLCWLGCAGDQARPHFAAAPAVWRYGCDNEWLWLKTDRSFICNAQQQGPRLTGPTCDWAAASIGALLLAASLEGPFTVSAADEGVGAATLVNGLLAPIHRAFSSTGCSCRVCSSCCAQGQAACSTALLLPLCIMACWPHPQGLHGDPA